MFDGFGELLIRSVIGISVSLLATYFICHAMRDSSLASWGVTLASIRLSGAPLVIVLWLSYFGIFYGLGAVFGEGVLYMLIWAAALALFVTFVCIVVSVPVAYKRVTLQWSKAVIIALIPLAVHLLSGWPQQLLWGYVHEAFKPVFKVAERKQKQSEEMKYASDLLKQFGLQLPGGIRIVDVSPQDYLKSSKDLTDYWVVVDGNGDAESSKKELQNWLVDSGYRLIHYDAWTIDYYIKEPFIISVGDPGQNDPDTNYIRLWMSQEDKGEDFSKWFPDWDKTQ
jgi:hypothetical protein